MHSLSTSFKIHELLTHSNSTSTNSVTIDGCLSADCCHTEGHDDCDQSTGIWLWVTSLAEVYIRNDVVFVAHFGADTVVCSAVNDS